MKILVLSIHQDMGATFVQTVCANAQGTSGTAVIDGQEMAFSVLAEDPRDNAAWSARIQTADVLVMLVRFLDALSLDRIKYIRNHLPDAPPIPMAVLLFREEGEIDFKMSCPACGQKLWVRDTDEDKRGRCPNCKKAFRLPSQAQHVKAELSLPDAVPVTRVVRGNASSCRNALVNLKGHLAGGIVTSEQPFDASILMKSTVRMEVDDEDLS